MKLNIAVLAGDGIGPEIMKQGVAVMQAIAEKFNHEFTYNKKTEKSYQNDKFSIKHATICRKSCIFANRIARKSV